MTRTRCDAPASTTATLASDSRKKARTTATGDGDCGGFGNCSVNPDSSSISNSTTTTIIRSSTQTTPAGGAAQSAAAATPTSIRRYRLTPELTRRIMKYFIVKPVRHDDVTVVKASSHDGRHPLSACLDPSEDNWYMSKPKSMPSGIGNEFVEFQLVPSSCSNESCRRLVAVSLKIPPLPNGPLSVRQFQLQVPRRNDDDDDDDDSTTTANNDDDDDDELSWRTVGGDRDRYRTTFRLENRTGWQRFELEPCETNLIRVVCLSNQMSTYLQRPYNPPRAAFTAEQQQFDSVGFYSIRFD